MDRELNLLFYRKESQLHGQRSQNHKEGEGAVVLKIQQMHTVDSGSSNSVMETKEEGGDAHQSGDMYRGEDMDVRDI